MADASVTRISGDDKVVMLNWILTTADHTGAAAEWCQYADRTITFVGTHGANIWGAGTAAGNWGGAVAALEGSNDGTVWQQLADVQGTAISTSAANKIETAVELTRFVRPRLTTAGTAAVVACTLVMRKN
jgi:hypothetical protein